jgi:hypothetical protein
MTPLQKVDLVGLNATDTLIPVVEFPVRGCKLEYGAETVMSGRPGCVDCCRLPDMGTEHSGCG